MENVRTAYECDVQKICERISELCTPTFVKNGLRLYRSADNDCLYLANDTNIVLAFTPTLEYSTTEFKTAIRREMSFEYGKYQQLPADVEPYETNFNELLEFIDLAYSTSREYTATSYHAKVALSIERKTGVPTDVAKLFAKLIDKHFSASVDTIIQHVQDFDRLFSLYGATFLRNHEECTEILRGYYPLSLKKLAIHRVLAEFNPELYDLLDMDHRGTKYTLAMSNFLLSCLE